MSNCSVIYCSCTCGHNLFKKIYDNSKQTPGQQVQKYHRLMLSGLSRCEDFDVYAVSKIPCTKEILTNVGIEDGFAETDDNIQYRYLPPVNGGKFGLIQQIWDSKKIVDSMIRNGEADVAIIDVLDIAQNIGTIIACHKRGVKVIGIITDLPEMIGSKLFTILGNWIISKCDAYLELTDAMDSRIGNNGQKPHMIMEGLVDAAESDTNVIEKSSKKICMYSGSLNRIHGIDYLVQGFINADVPDAELHLYGNGDYVEEIKNICQRHKNVIYHGTLLNNEIVLKQKEAWLLINPRPTDKEFVKYSFPSKNMEYMVSGTPVLTTALPGMPNDYYPYVYIIESENAEGISENLKTILAKSNDELVSKGKSAKGFVLENKNYLVQGKKFHDFIVNEIGIL